MKRILTILVGGLIAGCAEPVPFEESFRAALETAEPGDVIDIPEGIFSFDRSLIMNTDGVTIRGQGMDKSILSFKDQLAGAEGLSVSASNFTIEDLAIEDAIGDALKVNEGSNIVIRRIRTEWTNGPDVNNGAYGIYPVQTTNVLIEDNVAIAASDAGIYVGQSEQIIVRGNRAEYNVAGIEVENSVGADVYNNIAVANTGGILVFNMPGIPKRGYGTRVFDNDVNDNNTANFAAAGTAVSGVPAGSGIMVNSNDEVEIFNNRISGNKTANIVISSYFSANYAGQREVAAEFDPYPELIYIYDNDMSGSGSAPGMDYLVALRDAIYGPEGAFPDIIWDGIIDPNKPEERNVICVDNGDAVLLSIDAGNEFANPTTDMVPYQCHVEKLSAIELTAS
jgi:parallel beta-helix repeat protein